MNRLINKTTDPIYDLIILECIKDVEEVSKQARRDKIKFKLGEIRDWNPEKIHRISKNVALGASMGKNNSVEKAMENLIKLIQEAQEEIGQPQGTMKVDVFTREVLLEAGSELWRNVHLFDVEGADRNTIEKNMDYVDEIVEKAIRRVIVKSCQEIEEYSAKESKIQKGASIYDEIPDDDSIDNYSSEESISSLSGDSDSSGSLSENSSDSSESLVDSSSDSNLDSDSDSNLDSDSSSDSSSDSNLDSDSDSGSSSDSGSDLDSGDDDNSSSDQE